MYRIKSFFTILVLTILSSCSSDPLDVDVSGIQIPPVTIQRYDRDFFAGDTAHPAQLRADLQQKYDIFNTAIFNNLICLSARDSQLCLAEMRRFLQDKDMRGVWRDANKLYPDFKPEEEQLSTAYRYFKYHFPKRTLPRTVQVVMTGFAYNYIQTEGNFGVGIEYFLGKNSAWYDALQWPMYRRMRYERPYIIPGLIRSWMLNEFPYRPEKDNVINRMIYEGKLLYLSKALLRNQPDSVLTGFMQRQLEWCVSNEGTIWAAMIDKKLLYSEDPQDIQHMTEDAPFTAEFPRESPGRIGIWTGLRIVESFMKRNPQTSLEELMRINDGQLILTKSKYKPRL